ncbi:MAG: hypothetical protein CM15mP40_12770 [Alphaproteobacteria bacterium]|nr:MAG: hypothetical protein CM15mP40_12770 [Alphaproteobacteria bacterium]
MEKFLIKNTIKGSFWFKSDPSRWQKNWNHNALEDSEVLKIDLESF